MAEQLPEARLVVPTLVAARAELHGRVAAASSWLRDRALALTFTALASAALLSFHAWLAATARAF